VEEIKPRSVLAQIRQLVPHRPLTPGESRQIIERQATRLLKLAGIEGPPVPIRTVAKVFPRVRVSTYPGLPTSGRTQWAGSGWAILIDPSEPAVRQRFSLGHELAHVIYHPLATISLPPLDSGLSAEDRLEQACEYFAACLLLPRVWVKRAYFEGIQDVPSLARLFNVSWVALRIRLEQLGLVARLEPAPARSTP
jgi:predicted transcriptional regulator